MNAFGSFVENYVDGALLAACQNLDFTKMGTIYNGDGTSYDPK